MWNLDEGRSAKARSWKIVEELQATVALLNEARVPTGGLRGQIMGGESTVGRDDKIRKWSTAIFSPHKLHDPEDVWTTAWGKRRAPLANTRAGSWTAAVVSIPDVGEVTAVALYGLLDERSDASVHRSLSDLTPLFEDRRYGERLVIGGDLNTWTGWAAGSRHLARDEAVLQRIEAFGFVDCLVAAQKSDRGPLAGCPCRFGDACTHTRTRLDRNNPEIPYQMDYLFASPALAAGLITCEALDMGENNPSDHFPIRATFAK